LKSAKKVWITAKIEKATFDNIVLERLPRSSCC